jgi:prepilin-type N-terminal cleavage/methylation domain-containing protein
MAQRKLVTKILRIRRRWSSLIQAGAIAGSRIALYSEAAAMRRGFTFIEILTTLGIIVIIAAISYPVMISAKESSRQSVCTSNLKQLWTATELYRNEQGQVAEVGTIYEMGLPPQRQAAVIAKNLSLACMESKRAPGTVNGYEYMPIDPEHPLPQTWAEYVRHVGQDSVVWSDWNHNDDQTMKMVSFPKLALGVTLSGSLLKRKAIGDPYITVWWFNQQGEK